MSADTLTTPSRDFYENSKIKVAISLTFAGIGLLLLGYASLEGGLARAAGLERDRQKVGWIEDALDAQASGYGFSCFVKLLGAILAFAVSIYFSPVFCGSLNEKKTIRTPLEVEQVYPEYSSSHGKDVIVEEENPAANNQA